MKKLAVILMGLLLMCSTGASNVFASTVYTNDFESGSLGAIQNAQVKETEGYKNHGFGDYYAWSDAKETNAITLQLNDLPEHSYLKIEFDLAVINSWDGNKNEWWHWWEPDYFNVKVDGTSIFHETFSNFDKSDQSYSGDPIVWNKKLARTSGWPDSAYHISLEIPHTSDTAKITWFASGTDYAWQGGWDESYAIDNIKVFAAVPIPASAWILGSGLLGLVAIRRKMVE